MVERQWVFKRNCSLTPRQAGAAFAGGGLLSLLVAMFFAWQGAWLVLPFAFLEVLALAAAFVMYAHHATDFERVTVRPGEVIVEHRSGNRLDRRRMIPGYVRIDTPRKPTDPVVIRAAAQELTIGRLADPRSREQFRKELRSVLSCA